MHRRLGRELDDKARKIRNEYDEAKKALKHAMPHHISMGLEGVANITKELKIKGGKCICSVTRGPQNNSSQ